jgi:hypothetical protein
VDALFLFGEEMLIIDCKKKLAAEFEMKDLGLMLIIDCKKKLAAEFEMKDLGLMQYFLGLELW